MTGTQEPRMTTAPNEPPPEGSSGPQGASEAATAAQDVQAATDAAEGRTAAPALTGPDLRRALAFNAVGPALNERGEWLPLSVRQAVADAVLAAVDTELQQLQARAEKAERAVNLLADQYRALEEQLVAARSTVDHVTRLAAEYPVYIDTAFIEAVLDEQEQAVVDPELQQLRAQVARVHAYLISLCAEPHPSHGHVCPDDVRRDVLAALDQPQGEA